MSKSQIPRTRGKALASTTFFECSLGSASQGTSVLQTSLLAQLCGSSGLLATFPQAMSTVVQEGTNNYLEVKLRLKKMKLRVLAIGSESNAIVAADSYNNVRFCVYRVGSEFADSTGSALVGGGIVAHPRTHDALAVLWDRVFTLPTQALYTSGGTTTSNVPQIQFEEVTININQEIVCYSPANGGAGAWSTREFNWFVDTISDSSVSPNPKIDWAARIEYELVH